MPPLGLPSHVVGQPYFPGYLLRPTREVQRQARIQILWSHKHGPVLRRHPPVVSCRAGNWVPSPGRSSRRDAFRDEGAIYVGDERAIVVYESAKGQHVNDKYIKPDACKIVWLDSAALVEAHTGVQCG